jgi:hypothetical protein
MHNQNTGEKKMQELENLLKQLILQQKSTAWNLNRIANTLEDVTQVASSRENLMRHLRDAVGDDVDAKLKELNK